MPPGTLAATRRLIELDEAVRAAGAAGTDTGPAVEAGISGRVVLRTG